MDFSTLMQQASANQEYTKKRYDEIKRINKEEEIRQKMKEQQQRERTKRKFEAILAEEKARKIKPPPLVQASDSEHSTPCKAHINSNGKKEKSTDKTILVASGQKTVPPVSIKGRAPKHKATTSNNASSQQSGFAYRESVKPLDFKRLMEIASQKSGNKSKELVQQKLSSSKKSSIPLAQEKKPKQVEQAGTKKPQSAVPAKQISTHHKGLAINRNTSAVIPQQRTPSGTTTKQVGKVANRTETKSPSVKLKTTSFYQSSAIGSDWSDMKKVIRKPQLQQQQCCNGFNISGSWINELGLNRLPTDLDSDEDDDMSDFVASDDEGLDDGDNENYSAAIRDIFGYDRSRFCNDDNEVMESSYSQQQFEEKRSARIGKEEDAEELRKELEEMRKKHKKIKLK